MEDLTAPSRVRVLGAEKGERGALLTAALMARSHAASSSPAPAPAMAVAAGRAGMVVGRTLAKPWSRRASEVEQTSTEMGDDQCGDVRRPKRWGMGCDGPFWGAVDGPGLIGLGAACEN